MKDTKDVKYSASDCIEAFCNYMNTKATEIGMKNSKFLDPAGVYNHSTTKDILYCLLNASGHEVLYDIWNKKKYVLNVGGINKRELILHSTGASNCLADAYRIMGIKGGTLNLNKVYNVAVLAEVPDTDDWLACVVMSAEQPNNQPNNKYQAAKQAIDAALKKYYDKNADNSDSQVCALCAAVCKKPKNNPRAYSEMELPMLFEKNVDEVQMPASMTKILTAIVTLEWVANLHTRIVVTEEDLALIPRLFYQRDFLAGDIITVKDALYALLLPSSNAAAYILARFVGNKMLE